MVLLNPLTTHLPTTNQLSTNYLPTDPPTHRTPNQRPTEAVICLQDLKIERYFYFKKTQRKLRKYKTLLLSIIEKIFDHGNMCFNNLRFITILRINLINLYLINSRITEVWNLTENRPYYKQTPSEASSQNLSLPYIIKACNFVISDSVKAWK